MNDPDGHGINTYKHIISHEVNVDDRQYLITHEAIAVFMFFFGTDFSIEDIVERLVRKFPREQHFNALHVLEAIKESRQ